MSEVETWRQQQMELQDQQAMQIRAKQEAEAELDRHKQVGEEHQANANRIKTGGRQIHQANANLIKPVGDRATPS